MADTTQLRVADRDGFADNDPFAELTRIMGFDPREPVRQPEQTPAPAASVEAQSADIVGDDFGIDLEKELMGEFGLDEGRQADAPHYPQPGQSYAAPEPAYEAVEPAQAYQPAAYAPEAESVEPAASHGVDAFQEQGYDAGQVQFEPVDPVVEGYASEAAGHFETAPVVETADDYAVEPSFDAAVAASMEDELGLAGDWVVDEPALTEDNSPAEEPRIDAYEPSFEPAYEPVAAYDRADATFDEPVAEEAASGGDWQPAVDAAPAHASEEGWNVSAYAPQIQPEPEVQAPAYDAELAAEQDFAEDFDAALAEVDMDFTAVPLASAGGSSFDASVLHAQEPSFAADPVAADEPSTAGSSLEDELNALLGNMAAPLSVSPEPVVAANEPELSFESAAFAADAVEVQPELVAETPVEEPAFTQARSDYGYARGNFRIPTEDDAVPAQAEAFHPAEPEAVYAEPAFAVEAEPEPVASAEPDMDFNFDDDAFEEAFASSIGDEDAAATRQVEEPQAVATEPDPYAELAALTASFKSQSTASWNQPVAEPAPAAAEQQASFEDMNIQQSAYAASNEAHNPAGYDDYPEIETIDVPEQAVALADDLDIPELPFEEDEPVAAAFDDLDAEFAGILNDMSTPEPAPAPQAAKPAMASDVDDFVAEFEREFQLDNNTYNQGGYAPAAAGLAAAAGAFGAAAAASRTGTAGAPAQAFAATDGTPAGGQYQYPPMDDFEYDPDAQDDMMPPAYAAQEQRPRRGMLIAAIIGGVVVLGGVGAFALSGGGGSGAPAVITADQSPIKVRPENPGGAAVPNQDNKVYDTVARTSSNEPAQQRLVTTAEQPIDMAAQEETPLDEEDTIVGSDEGIAPAAGKSEDRIQQAIQEDSGSAQHAEVAAVAPRKVRTMIVRSDGTLVPREDPAPAVDPATTSSEGAPVANEPVPAEATMAPKVAAQPSSTPASVAIAPSRPSDQPVNVVGEVKPDQVAALNTNAGAAGEWAMQIASQPTEAAAQASYQDLLRRYGNVLNGHQANIVKAEIAGKGTFYRVRVPAQTRNDAISLCESYKAAGGNCFVSK